MSGEELLREAGEALGKYYDHLKRLQRDPLTTDVLRSADECDAEIEAWRAKGVKDDDPIYCVDFNDHPKAKNNTVPFAEMKAISATYRPLYARYKVAFDLWRAENALLNMRDYTKPDESYVHGEMIADLERAGDPEACRAALAAARALDPELRVGSNRRSLDEFAAAVCEPLGTVTRQWVAAARAALRARNEAAAAPYAAAGIAGDKLDLIVSYAGVSWRLVGGERTDDPKKLATASLLFQWLEAPDRADPRWTIHTIRRYEFQGNSLAGVTEKQYRRAKGDDLSDTFK